MFFEVHAGDQETQERVRQRARVEFASIASGLCKKTIYLNGGSETRREAREFYEELYRNSIFRVETTAFSVTIKAR